MIKKRKIAILIVITLFISSGAILSIIFPAYMRKSNINNKSSSLINKNVIVEEIDISKINLININVPTKKQTIKNGEIPQASDFNPPVLQGVSFKFIKASPVNNLGSSTVKYRAFNSVKKLPEQTKDFSFVVSGFQSKASADIEKANQKIDDLTKTQITTKPLKNGGKIVEYNTKPNAVNDDVSLPLHPGFKFSLIAATRVDENGISQLTYQARVNPYVLGSKTKNFVFTLDKFQTKNELLAKLNEDIDNLQASDIENPPTKKQQVKHNNSPTSEDINLPSKNGYVFTFQFATPVYGNGFSYVTFSTTKNKIEGVKSKYIDFKVSGFETKTQAEQRIEIIRKANEKITNLNIVDVSKPTVKNTDFYYDENNFNPPSKNEFTFKYKSSTHQSFPQDLIDGVAYVTYEVNVLPKVEGTQTKEMEFKVLGFKKIKNDLLSHYGGSEAINPVPKKILSFGSTPTADDLFLPFLNDFTFGFIEASKVDENGISKIKYRKISKDKSEEIVTFDVSGFQTKAMTLANKIQSVKEWNDKIKAVTLKTLEKLPTIVWKTNEEGKRAIDYINPPVQKGFKFNLLSQKIVLSWFPSKKIVNSETKYYLNFINMLYSTFEVYTDEVEKAIRKPLSFKNHSEVSQKEYNRQILKFDLKKVMPPTIKTKILKKGKPDIDNFIAPKDVEGLFFLKFLDATPINIEGKTVVTYKIMLTFPHYADNDQTIKFIVSGFND